MIIDDDKKINDINACGNDNHHHHLIGGDDDYEND